jgi:hypothetical protein
MKRASIAGSLFSFYSVAATYQLCYIFVLKRQKITNSVAKLPFSSSYSFLKPLYRNYFPTRMHSLHNSFY